MSEQSQEVANRSLTRRLWLFAAGSFGFGFALVPLYSVLCDVTGYGNGARLAQAAAAVTEGEIKDRTITVEFISTVPTFGTWEFRPEQSELQVHPGKLYEATFYARNTRDQPVVAQAVPDIAPSYAVNYFHKTECFCFTPQAFDAHQERELKVRFIVDPQIPTNLDRLTLGYAMYDAKGKTS